MSRDFDDPTEYGNFEANLCFIDRTGELNRGVKILEIGCGKGSLLNHLVRRDYDVAGVEISEALIQESRRIYGKLPLCRTLGESLSFKDSSFDIVLSFDVFEHFPDNDRHLREVRRVLKPGGFYLLQTPNKWTNVIFETLRWKSLTKWKRHHCSLHNYWEIRKRFAKNNFKIAFYEVPLVNDYFKLKVRRYLGGWGLYLLRIINPDRLPIPLKTNFYIKAQKEGSD